jgi:hypothetical protein
MIYSRPEEQIQEHLRLKKSATLLLVIIGALGSPLGSYLESDLAIHLYSGSTPIAIMNESDHHISFNSFKESVTLLPAAIRAMSSPLGPHPESDLATYLYSSSTPIANMDESNRQISFNRLKKSATSLSAVIEALGSSLGHYKESDLATDLYSGSTLIANMDEFDRRISFNHLKKSMTSLSATIGTSSSPLGPHLESNLAINLYSDSILIAIMDESMTSLPLKRTVSLHQDHYRVPLPK